MTNQREQSLRKQDPVILYQMKKIGGIEAHLIKKKNLLIEKLKTFVMKITRGEKRRKVIKLIVMRKANLIKMILDQEIKKDFKMKIVPKKKNPLLFQNFCLNCLVPDQSIKTV